MKWGVMIAEAGRKLGAALKRDPIKANDIPAAIEELATKARASEEEVGSLQAAYSELESERNELNRTRERLESQIADTEERLSAAREKLNTNAGELNMLRNRVADRDRTIDRLIREADRVRIPRLLRPLFVRRVK